MKLKMVFLATLIVCVLNIGSVHSLQEDTMDGDKGIINAEDPSWSDFSSGILKSHSGSVYKPGRQKSMLILAPKGYSIFAAIRMFDIRPNSQDSLQLNEFGTLNMFIYRNTLSYRNQIYDSREEKKTIFAKNGQLSVVFTTGPSLDTYRYKGFELIYTVQANYTKCLSSNFHCNNRQCISNDLTCDGHNHCGDRSDQLNCSPSFQGFGSGKVAGVVGGVIFLVIAVACIIYIIFRRSIRSQREVRTIINHPPEAHLPGYVPPNAYPMGTHYPPPPQPYTNYNQGVNNPGFR